ncbi:MAG: hypothetical protein AAFR66_18930 [Bacteroidota bacterium]
MKFINSKMLVTVLLALVIFTVVMKVFYKDSIDLGEEGTLPVKSTFKPKFSKVA